CQTHPDGCAGHVMSHLADSLMIHLAAARQKQRRGRSYVGSLGGTERHNADEGRGNVSINDILNRLEAEERAFVTRHVLPPALAGRAVAVRIAGIVCALRSEAAEAANDVAVMEAPGGRQDAVPPFEGWAILQPLATDRARIVRPARLAEVRAYLRLFSAIQLIVVARERKEWWALPAHAGDTRFQIAGPAAVLLAEEGVQPFETVVARFDGRLFWYERRDARRNPALAAYLREALNAHTKPGEIARPGLSA